MVLKFYSLATVVSAFNRTDERPLKARVLDVYRDKSHMKCYNFCSQFKDYFATTGATSQNRVLFTTIFAQRRSFVPLTIA